MDKNIENALDNFVGNEKDKKKESAKKVVLDEREGLIERVDKILITKEGKQLLREHY